MPPSQLKRLKASLREQGITGPQKSKKQKKNQKTGADQHMKKAAVLAAIREASNPFDFKHLSRPKKFEYTTTRQDAKVLGRPAVTKSLGEETRRRTLLPEMNRRNKVGGILDRRIGESDPTMSLDERMMARFEREQQRRRENVFDLEEADEDEVELTHGGKALTFDGHLDGEEDYDAASVDAGSDDEGGGFLRLKRKRDDEELGNGDEGSEEAQPEQKKTKKEVMEEVIAKSKQHKYERQQQKEDDLDLMDELDKGLPDILAALGRHMSKSAVSQTPKNTVPNDFAINPERAALLAGEISREDADKEYDKRIRQLQQDQRAKPTSKTLTAEEKAQVEAKRLQELEEKRTRRMAGLPDSSPEPNVHTDRQDEMEGNHEEWNDAKGKSLENLK
jgi:nucleolar protein 14